MCHELGRDDATCSKQRSYANVINTPLNVTQEVNSNTNSMISYKRTKICHKSKQPGHIKKNCPAMQYDVTGGVVVS